MAENKFEFSSMNISFGGYVSTPFFPISYPDDLSFEQMINCKVVSSSCQIHLIFMDFQIAEESVVEVRMHVTYMCRICTCVVHIYTHRIIYIIVKNFLIIKQVTSEFNMTI